MGACCGKPDRKTQGYVLGGVNTTTPTITTSTTPAKLTGNNKPTPVSVPVPVPAQQRHTTGGRTLGGASSPPPKSPDELSASAKAALKRAQQNERRGAPNDGKLARELVKKNKETNKELFQQSNDLDQLPKRGEWN